MGRPPRKAPDCATDSDFDLFVKAVSAPGNGERRLRTPRGEAPDDWSPDGRFILCTSGESPKRNVPPSEIWAPPIDGDRTPFPVIRMPGAATNGAFSPNGTWVAFQSNESNRFEIYVQPFPRGDKVRISTSGGVQPRWRPPGKELFYIDPDNQRPSHLETGALMARQPSPGGESLRRCKKYVNDSVRCL